MSLPKISEICQGDSIKEKMFHTFLYERKNILLIGAGGTGKSYTIHQLVSLLKELGKSYVVTATTGIASVNIEGQTIHSWAGTGINIDIPLDVILTKIKRNKKLVDRWRDIEVIILDEISMLGKRYFEVLNFVAQKIRRNNELFGGIQLFFSGDFLQLPPVNDDWLFKSKYFTEWVPFEFKIAKRYDDAKYFDLLQRIRIGDMTYDDYNILLKRKKEYNQLDFEKLEIRPTIVYSKKIDVRKINERELDNLEGEAIFFSSVDKKIIVDAEGTPVEVDVTEQEYKIDNSIPRIVYLKKKAQVILKANLNIEKGLCNGSRGVVTEINNHLRRVTVKFKNGMYVDIDFHRWETEIDGVIYYREQMPLILGYAVTVHSCQGMTLDSAVLDLGYSIFSPAQAYVALSRVRTLDGLYISKIIEKSFFVDEEACNYLDEICPKKIWIYIEDYDKEAIDDLEEELKDTTKKISIQSNKNLNLSFKHAFEKIDINTDMDDQELYQIFFNNLPEEIYIVYKKRSIMFSRFKKIINSCELYKWKIDV